MFNFFSVKGLFMKVSVFGLGYVGVVTAGCLAQEGHQVIGVDYNAIKVDLINQGVSPIIENELGEIISKCVRSDKLKASTDPKEAICNSDLSIVCVGTPSQVNGSLDLTSVHRVCEQIGKILADKEKYHTVVVRSTILPGTMAKLVIPTLEKHSKKVIGKDFGVCFNPEFLREGSAIYDYYHPPKIVIGAKRANEGDCLTELYEKLEAPIFRTSLEVAEMIKYVDNTWHALKVAFGNEIGSLCKKFEIDSHQVMDIFCKDTKLNISAKYLKPGFAFGGSCLPKDIRALKYMSRNNDLDLPLIESILPSNQLHIERGLSMIMRNGKRKVGVLGFSFKEGTDDLRESPIVEVIERLIGKGYELKLYDRNVNLASLMGANRDYILNRIPHISKLMMTTIDGVIDHSEIVVIGNQDKEFSEVSSKIKPDQVVIDFVRTFRKKNDSSHYDGIAW